VRRAAIESKKSKRHGGGRAHGAASQGAQDMNQNTPAPWAAAPLRASFLALSLAAAAGAAGAQNALDLPPSLQGRVEVLKLQDPDYEHAAAWKALKGPGDGGVLGVVVVRVKEDVPVYRLWNGPQAKDANGNTNRLGGWWSADKPKGSVQQYRNNYEVCTVWNRLSFLAACTLRKGAVVAVGPGQSVSNTTCNSTSESYPQERVLWQIYIDQPWKRAQELSCPPDTQDVEVDPSDVSKPKLTATAAAR
jgi:hypothetical protein